MHMVFIKVVLIKIRLLILDVGVARAVALRKEYLLTQNVLKMRNYVWKIISGFPIKIFCLISLRLF